MDSLVSVIIPVYNAQNTIKNTINSVLVQTYSNIEIIAVNDGSTDDSLRILESLSEKEENLIVVNKYNGGVSSARNKGVKISKGEYIVFLDADDTLEEDIIELAISKIEPGSNLYQWGMKIQNVSDITIPSILDKNYSRIQMIANCIFLMDEQIGLYFRASWGKLLIASIIKNNHITFREDLYIGEDAVFMLEYLKYIEKYILVKNTGYNYLILNSSATRRYKTDLLKQSFVQMDAIYQFVITNDLINNQLISGALTNLRWWLYTSVFDNSYIGVKNKTIKKKNLFSEAFSFNDKYSFISNAHINHDLIKGEYRKLNDCNSNNRHILAYESIMYKYRRTKNRS